MRASVPLDAIAAATWDRVKRQPTPALLIDVAASVLLDANESGCHFWSGPQCAPALPRVLDKATPALRLLCMAEGGERRHMLCLWTDCGVRVRAGTVLPLGDRVHVAVTFDEMQDVAAVQDKSSQTAPRQSGNAKLAHELRTPIGAVAAYAEVLAGEHFGPLGNARYREYAQNMRESALHALAVIEGMMGGAREGNGLRRELRFRDVDPADVVQGCVTVIRPIADAAQVQLQVAVPASLPRIIADEVSLRQMLLNLLTNAVKFARPDDRVSVGVTYADDGSLTFAVEDTGPGLTATRREDTPAAKGLGLGLPLTRELAEANGAALAIDSAPGHGTRARISFDHTRVVI